MIPLVHRGLPASQDFLRAFLGEVPLHRVLLVARPHSFERSGAKAWWEQVVDGPVAFFSDFSSNPKSADVMRGVARFREIQAAAVIAIGGGSVLDMAKLIKLFGSCDYTVEEYLSAMSAPEVPGGVPLLAIPTTAGSGSEATHFAVVYSGNVKYSVADSSILPGHVALIPEFTWSASAYQTACSGMDALAQAIESHWAPGATDASRADAEKAIALAKTHLLTAVREPTAESRAGMLEAAHLAGRAINITKTTGAHAYSYALTMKYGISHGHAAGLLLPFFVDFHEQAGIRVPDIEASWLRTLLINSGLDTHVSASADLIEAELNGRVNAERLGNNPVPVTRALVAAIAQGLAG
jgi:alcohol dehydrogenase class IV